ncbi:MAG: hypothetical protein HY927_00360 [Elusimicrobia bacterium]|nr:hypothetical protein [Elusimicrobiota bacterium]
MKSVLIAFAFALSAAAQEADVLSGKVAETMDAGEYTYARVVRGKASTWFAVPHMPLKAGDEVSFQPGLVMKGFQSKTLKRTFPRIIFSDGPSAAAGAVEAGGRASAAPSGKASAAAGAVEAGGRASAAPSGKKSPDPHAGMKGEHGGMPGSHGGMPGAHGMPAAGKAFAGPVKTEKAKGPDAYTVAEVHGKRAELAGKSVSVRGTVVKFSARIMDRNWIHLQDGSGEAAKGTHDLTVTSQDSAKPGEAVTVKGSVAKDKDFGMGYSYPVLIEKAVLSR